MSVAFSVLSWVLGLLAVAAACGAVYLQARGALAGMYRSTRQRGVRLALISGELIFLACLLSGTILYLRQPHSGLLLLIVLAGLFMAAALYVAARLPDWFAGLLGRIARQRPRSPARSSTPASPPSVPSPPIRSFASSFVAGSPLPPSPPSPSPRPPVSPSSPSPSSSVERLSEQSAAHFGGPPALVVRSPGRVNLIGEHTDYNDGYVLPAAVDLGTWVAAAPRGGGRLRTVAARLGEADDVPLHDLRPQAGPTWTRYVRGMAALLQGAGCILPGADLLIDGDLPLSGGLSSSASLELGVGLALAALAGFSITPRDLALLAQRAEHDFAGVLCGIMDQFAVALGQAGHALLIDCRSQDVELVPLCKTLRILVLDSAVPRTLAGSAYNRRRAECAEAVRQLQAVHPEVQALRDADLAMLAAAGLEGVVLRRARHVVTENARVLECAAALRRGDLAALEPLLAASHASLRDDYEVSGPELDALVEIASGTPGVYGARLTGAGFGGCCVALADAARAEDAAAAIVQRYRQGTGRAGQAYVCAPAQGAHVQSAA